MGRRSINFTKSGKYMNPTDQARKEARKKELKKNKKQRMMVRMAVLKGKDPSKLLEEMDVIDNMEYDPNAPATLSERVLKDKRKKLKETYDRVISMYEKEDPEYALELRSGEVEYEKRRRTKQMLFDQVKNAEKVQLDQIPLPDAPNLPTSVPAQIPLPGDIPLPIAEQDDAYLAGSIPPKGILKKSSAYERSKMTELPLKKRKPPGPPPGAPPMLSDSEGEEVEDMEDIQLPSGRPADRSDYSDSDSEGETIRAKHRTIRFEDDKEEEEEDNTDEEEEDDMETGKRRKKKKVPTATLR